MVKEKFLAVKEALASLNVSDLVCVWNRYCEANGYYDDNVEYMDSFNELMDGQKPSWIADRIYFGDFNPCDEYFGFDAYGNLISWTYEDDKNCPITISQMVDWFIDKYEEKDEYIFTEDLQDEFVDYINKRVDRELSFDEIVLMNNDCLVHEITDIVSDDWDMWLENTLAKLRENSQA